MSHSSIVGGSSAGRVIACPPSRILSQGVPESEDNVHSRRGTALHTAIEIAISTGSGDFASLVGAVIDGHMITEQDVIEGLMPAWHEFTSFNWSRSTILLERQVSLPNISGAFGTIDVLGRTSDGIPVVWDWKFGKGIQVYPEDNPQLLFYAAGAMFGQDTRHMFKDSSKVMLVIVQPNDRGEPTSRMILVDQADVFDFTVKLADAVNAGMTAPFSPGEHCRWCPSKLICPKLNETVKQLPTVNRETLADLLDLIGPLEAWINEVHRTAHELLEAGEQVPRYKLVAKAARRQWTDSALAATRLRSLGVPVETLFDLPELRSPAQVQKLVPDEVFLSMKSLIEARSSGTVVVPETDRRASVAGLDDALARLAKQLN